MPDTDNGSSDLEWLVAMAFERVAGGEPAYLLPTPASPVGEIAAAVRRHAEEAGVRIRLDVSDDLVVVQAAG
jgi:hypothetical protein